VSVRRAATISIMPVVDTSIMYGRGLRPVRDGTDCPDQARFSLILAAFPMRSRR
jgi:hypothetical protein